LLRALNAVLPSDVAIVAIDSAPDNFHATRDAIGKRYRYRIHNGRVPSVFDRTIAWHYPQPLDAEKMHAAAQALVGRHDFSSFETAGSERPNSIRTIWELSVVRSQPIDSVTLHPASSIQHPGSDLITIEVAGDGFLYNMVRTIVGTLVEVGKGARDAHWPAEVLAARDRKRAGQTAPPHGLFLVSVAYE
jgi:tRNA pseudouridine38-40 synthase